jgi:hypothetical protein
VGNVARERLEGRGWRLDFEEWRTGGMECWSFGVGGCKRRRGWQPYDGGRDWKNVGLDVEQLAPKLSPPVKEFQESDF